MANAQNEKNFFGRNDKTDHQLSESFYFIKICFGWVSYKSFPILFGVFLTQKLSLGYSRINPNRRDLEQLGKLLKTTYHHCSTYQYAKAQIKWVKNQKLIRCSNHCFQNWIFSWEFDKEFFSKNWRVKQEILVTSFLNLKHIIESGVSVMLNFVYYVFKGKQLK